VDVGEGDAAFLPTSLDAFDKAYNDLARQGITTRAVVSDRKVSIETALISRLFAILKTHWAGPTPGRPYWPIPGSAKRRIYISCRTRSTP
jgi:hypothetical protein